MNQSVVMQKGLSLDVHDPGGKVRLALPENVDSGAVFSKCQRYRQLLFRRWMSEIARPGYVLWIGMNPSTADGSVDDPTVFKERKFSARWGYADYRKCNVMDYRATKPKMLLDEGVIPCSDENLPAIIEQARGAALVVLGYGAPHKKLRHYGEKVISALRELDIPLYCLNVTKDGLPVHPLYQLDVAEPKLYLEDLFRNDQTTEALCKAVSFGARPGYTIHPAYDDSLGGEVIDMTRGVDRLTVIDTGSALQLLSCISDKKSNETFCRDTEGKRQLSNSMLALLS